MRRSPSLWFRPDLKLSGSDSIRHQRDSEERSQQKWAMGSEGGRRAQNIMFPQAPSWPCACLGDFASSTALIINFR